MVQRDFITDGQTISDLELLESGGNPLSVFSVFNKTRWAGGEQKLGILFETPLTDIHALRERVECLKFLGNLPGFFDFDREQLKFIEIYLSCPDPPRCFNGLKLVKQAVANRFKPDNDYYVRRRGVKYLSGLLNRLDCFFESCSAMEMPGNISTYTGRVCHLIRNSGLCTALGKEQAGVLAFGKLDYYFRTKERDKVREILNILYELDALKAVAETASGQGFAYPGYLEEKGTINIKGLWHPFLHHPVKNDVAISRSRNICFLTGPNMAGKSTYMKSLGIAVYLAHIGFPVPAGSMEISVFGGLLSTINLSDSIGLGYSHYYSEVLRVKYVAEEIVKKDNVVVIFDELFRGTNVKDAFDASLAVVSAFAGLRKSAFVISTHILELAVELKKYPSVDFRYFRMDMAGGEPRYTYKLLPGVSDERIGMYILNRERVVETILRAAGE